MVYDRKLDESIVINSVVYQMMKEGSGNGYIELSDNNFHGLDLCISDICILIKKIGYDVTYSPHKHIYKISKREKLFDKIGDKDFLYHYIEELKEDKYIEKYHIKILNLIDFTLALDEIAEIIEEFGYTWFFLDDNTVCIL